MDSTFRQQKARADMRRGSVAAGPQTTVACLLPAIFSNFDRHIFVTSRAEANIIMQLHGLPQRLSSDAKMLNL